MMLSCSPAAAVVGCCTAKQHDTHVLLTRVFVSCYHNLAAVQEACLLESAPPAIACLRLHHLWIIL